MSAPVDRLVAELAFSLEATKRAGKAHNGYAACVELVAGTEVVARVLHGGNGGRPHVFASSAAAAPLAEVLRRRFAEVHEVTRCDAAQDFDGAGTWERLSRIGLELAEERGLAIDQAGDWYRGRDGRTLYIGSRKSAVFLRIYEKGKQLRGLGVPGWEGISEQLVRVELQVRPEGTGRIAAARFQPVEAYGCAKWAQEAAKRIHGADVARVSLKPVRDSDDERALRAVVTQYAGVFERLAADRGGWDALLVEVERRSKASLLRRGVA